MEAHMTPSIAAAQSGRISLSIALLAALSVGAAGCSKLRARDMLNKGVQAYKAQKYDDAIERFKSAKELDPTLLNARLYLATAYANLYVAGATNEENINRGNQAIAEFQDVLRTDPKNLNAIDGIGSMIFQMGGAPYDPKKLEESRSYHVRHSDIKPDDPEPYYWVGVIDWTLSFRANAEMRSEYNRNNLRKQVKDTDGLPEKVRAEFAEKYGPVIDGGISSVKKAIELRQDYDDAMAYLNLLYRQKADAVESAEDRTKYLADADALIEKVKEIKQKKLEKSTEPKA
jgi:tetratricopeptide (TPR) repeat protein